jgi:hypothetical protein
MNRSMEDEYDVNKAIRDFETNLELNEKPSYFQIYY